MASDRRPPKHGINIMTSVEKPPSDDQKIADALREIGDKNRSALFDPENLKGLAILKLRARAAFEELIDHWRGMKYDVRGLQGEVSKTAKALELDDGQDDDPLTMIIDSADLWRDQQAAPFATVKVVSDDGSKHVEHLHIESKAFADWVGREFWKAYGIPPPEKEHRAAIKMARGRAAFGGARHHSWIRVAQHEGRIYIDLADDAWQVVEVDSDGWRICPEPPVRFRRAGDEASLPLPVSADPDDTVAKLTRLINLKHPGQIKLVLGAMVAALRPSRPCCILLFLCEPGSAKTTVLRIVCSVIDPRPAQESGIPPSEWDMAAVAYQQWIVAWDNIGRITEDVANAMCRLSTGGGHRKRGLYSDADVHALALQRPSVITGLSMPTARSDFVDRSIAVELGTIDTKQRLTEATLDAMMQELRPALFGLLLDGVSAALRNEVAVRDRLEGTNLPRMADFAVWAEAAGSAFGWRPNDLLDEYQGMLKQRMADAAEEDPLCAAVADMMHWVEGDPPVLIGKASDLLEHLRSHVERDWRSDTTLSGHPIGRSPAEARWFPINARAMRAQLEMNRRPLEALGVIWSTGPDPHSRTAGEVHTLKLGVKPSRLAGKADKEFARQSLDLTEEADRPWMREDEGL
jgi:hypothetical protein